ncbi:HAMP domain-containing sensor histidine kinase [Mollicutes bacterium LVI A0078]|nr:HAMP domain-containing sensor histidine kinase [Mollicutes bacterium LVI A0075]WOO91858.1 HAMP domain-containing sensor histidine kinase [Mollicutes bacterium LVI A0078]
MFRAFRNKVFAIYLVSILVLLIGSLSFVYIRSYSEMESSINQRLMDNKMGMDSGPKDGYGAVQPESEAVTSDANTPEFDLGEARDLTIFQNEDIEQKISEYVGEEYLINYQDQTIVSGDDTYMFRENDGVYKVIKITYDLEYIENLKTTLLIFGSLVIVVFSTFGFVFITKLIEPIKQSYETQNRFVSDASHELKTPLAIMKSCLQLIAANDEDKDNLVEYCQDETDRLIRLTSNLLQLSETDTIKYEKINVSQTAEILVSGLEVSLFEKNIGFKSDIAENIYCNIAKDDLNQLIHIFVDNAVKYNDDRKKVKLSISSSNRNLIIQVKNSSNQVSHEDLDLIFDRFYRIDNSRTEKGFGLGLSLAKHIVEKYDGEIKADYSGGYFTVNVKFPL